MKILQQVKNLLNASCDYMAKVNTVAELSQLSDHQLADIGMRRDHYNMKLSKVWNDDIALTTVATVKTQPAEAIPAKQVVNKPEPGFSQYLVSLYSSWNRPSYVV